MKKIVSLLAAMALSLASVTAFAADAVESDNIHVKFVADKTTVAPGEAVTISAYISANGSADVTFDTMAMFGLIFDQDNFTYEVIDEGVMTVEDYSTDDYGLLWSHADEASSYVASEACIQVKFTAKAEAIEDTYAFSVSEDSIDTGFSHGLFLFDPDVNNVTLTGTSVEVKAGGDDDAISATKTAGTNNDSYEFANVADDSKVNGQKVALRKTKVEGTAITENTRVKVTAAGRTQIYGGDMWAKLNAEGEGTLAAKNVTFGIIFSDADLTADSFTFEIIEQ